MQNSCNKGLGSHGGNRGLGSHRGNGGFSSHKCHGPHGSKELELCKIDMHHGRHDRGHGNGGLSSPSSHKGHGPHCHKELEIGDVQDEHYRRQPQPQPRRPQRPPLPLRSDGWC